jgi:hypothetical protein
MEAVEMLSDSRFLQDVKDFYYQRDGRMFSSDEEAVEKFWSDRTWRNSNVLMTGVDAIASQGYTTEQKERLGRIQTVFDSNPNFWEDGGRGAEGFWANAGAMLLDPTNLIGFGIGGVGAKAAAKAATMAGRKATGYELAKAGFIRGGASEAVASGGIEAGADALVQNRDMSVGIQDEYSLGRTAMAGGIGATVGGGIGGVLGGLAPTVGRKASELTGIDKLDFIKSGEAEGRVELQRIEMENAAKAAQEEEAAQDVDGLFGEYDTQLRKNAENGQDVLSNVGLRPDVNISIEAGSGRYNTAEEFAEAVGVDLNSPDFAQVKDVFDQIKLRTEHQRMKSVPSEVANLRAQADKAQVNSARGDAAADPNKIDANITNAQGYRSRANSLEAAYDRYTTWLRSGAFRNDDVPPPDVRSAMDEVTGLLGREPETGVVPANPRDRGDGFTMRDDADADAVQQQRAARGLDDPTIPPSRQIPEAPPGPRNVSGDGFEAVVDTSEAAQTTAPRTAAEAELSNAKEMYDNTLAKRDEAHRAIKNLQAKARRGSIGEDETAELSDLIKTRAQLRKELKQSSVRVTAAENALSKLANDIVDDITDTPTQMVEEGAEAQLAEAAEGVLETDAPIAVERTLEDGAIETAKTEGETLAFLDALGFDKKKMRREVRALTNGVTRAEARVIRAQFATEKVNRLHAASYVQQAIDMIGGVDKPEVYIISAMRSVIKSLDMEPGVEELALDVYNDFVIDNAPSILNQVVEGIGLGRSVDDYFDFIRVNYGDELVDVLHRHMRGELDTLDRIETSRIDMPKISDFTPSEQKALKEAMDILQSDGRTQGWNKSAIQMFANQFIANLRQKKADGINPFRDGAHEGKSVESFGTITVNGKEYSGHKLGKTQSILSPAKKGKGDYKYYGQLISALKRDGVTMTGREAAYRAADEAKLETATNSMRRDPVKYNKKTVDGETVHEGINAEPVRKIDEARKALKGIDPTEDATEIRALLISEGVIPNVELAKSSFRPQEMELGDPISIKSNYPKNVTGYKALSGSKRTDGSVFVLRRAIPLTGEALKKTAAGKVRLDGPRVGRATIKVITPQGVKEIPNHEIIDGILYERILASPGQETETPSGFNTFSGGDKVFADPNSKRLFATAEDIPENQRGTTIEDLTQDLLAQRKLLTQSTDLEMKARDIENFRSSDRAQFEAKYREYRNAARELQKMKEAKAKPVQVLAMERAVQAKKKEIRTEYPEMWKDRKVIKKGLVELELANNAGKIDDMKKEVADLADEAGDAPTPEDKSVAKVAADKASQQYADANKVSLAYQDAVARFQEHGDARLLDEELAKIRMEASKVSHEKPKTKPRAKRMPMVVKHRGVEVDLENHFSFTGTEDEGFDLGFLGQKIGRIEKTEEGFEVISDDLDSTPVYDSFDLAKRGLVDDFEPRIKVAFREGKLMAADAPEEVSFHEPNHQNTNTYKNAKQTDAADEDDIAEKFLGSDERLNQSGADYSSQVPPGRKFAIGIKTGPFAGVARAPSTEEKLVGVVLSKQSEQEFVLGHVAEGTNGTKASNSFIPFDPEDSFESSTKGQVKKERKPRKNELLEQDPDLEDPAKQAVSLNKTRAMDLDQEDLPEDLQGKFKTVYDLHDEIVNLERLPWNSPQFASKQDYQRFVMHLRTLNGLLDQYAPHGIKLPNASRHASMRQLTAVMGERPVGEINAVMSVLRNLSEGDSRMPRFIQDPNAYSHRPANYANTAELNSISVAEDLTPDVIPGFAKTIHEIGHWAYFNVLTPAERSTFWDAMGKYITAEGVDMGMIKKRLPEIGGNELRSPQEFFAQQFTQFAISQKRAGETTSLMKLWTKVAEKVQKIMRAFFIEDADAIDADLMPIFERILPEDDGSVNKFMQVAKKYSEAGTRVGYPAQKLAVFEDIRLEIGRAIDTGNEDAIEDALRGFVREVYAYSGKPGNKTITNRNTGKKISRVRLFDAKQIGEAADGTKKHDFVNSHFVRQNLVQRMYAIQRHLAENPKKVLSEEDRLAEIDKLLASQNSDDFGELNRASMTSTVMEATAAVAEDASEGLVLLANDVLGSINEAQTELRRRIARSVGKTDTGAGVKITPEGKEVATQDSVKGNKFRKRAQKRKQSVAENAEQSVQDTLAKMEAAISGMPSKMSAPQSGAETPSLKGESVIGLLTRYKKTRADSPEKREIAQEVANRMAARPELTPLEELPMDLQTEYSDKFKKETMSLHEAIVGMQKAMDDGDLVKAHQYQSFVGAVYGTLEIPSMLRSVHKAIDTETSHNFGSQTENGVPSSAPQAVKNALGLITHRDKRVEYTGRTVLYRVLNLMGKAEKDLVNQTEFLTFAELQNIIGNVASEAPKSAKRAMEVMDESYGTYLGQEGANRNNALMNALRKHFRKIGTNISKQGAPLRLVASGAQNANTGTQIRTALHEVGHMLVRTKFDEPKMQQLRKFLDDKLDAGDETASKFVKNYGTEAAAEEYFVDEFAKWMAGRVSAQDAFGEANLQNGMMRIIKELGEMVAYVMNGLVRNKTMRQEFRSLTGYGDMFRVRKRVQKPTVQAVASTDSYSMPATLAPRYAQETLANMPDGQRISAREFVGAREGEDLMDFVYYHGTPNGRAFSRAENPDVVLEPSGNQSLYGPGIYVTKKQGVAEDYSVIGHRASFERMINEATDDPAKRAEGAELTSMLINAREEINTIQREMNSTQYSQQTLDRAKRITSGEIEDYSTDGFDYQLSQHQRRLTDKVMEEDALWKALEKATGVTRKPAVLPLLVRADETFNMDANTFYRFGEGTNSVNWLIDEMAKSGTIPTDGAMKVMQRIGTRDFSGEDLYEALVEGVREQGIGENDAKAEIAGFLKDLGYDSMRITEVNPNSSDMIEALVLFEPTQVKHVDAQTFDYENPEIYQLRLGEGGFLGELGEAIIDNPDVDIAQMRATILNAAERMGAPKPVREFINKTSRGEALTPSDIEGVSRSYKGNLLGENSAFFRKNGAAWIGNILKPSNGAGLFQKHNADLAKTLGPVLTALRSVPDYGNSAKRFFEKSKGLAAPLMKSARQTKQPASHDRIMRALRQDDLSSLSTGERAIAQQLADVFAQELVDLKAAGYNVGDVLRLGKRYYIPQAWDTGMIRDNPRRFLNIMTDRFIKDRRQAGMPADRAQAELAAKTMMERMLDTDGRIDTDPILNKKMQSDPFYQRMINLDPEEIPEFEEFLVNDLEGIVTRYFDKTTRKLVLAREFGVQGHGFMSYRAVAEGGIEAAIRVLQTSKIVKSVRRDMEVEAEVEDVVIPPLRKTDEEIKSILTQIQTMVGGTTAQKTAQKQAAIDYLFNSGDLSNMDIGMRNNWRKRSEGIVNAIADFPMPAHARLLKQMDKMFNAINKRPIDGGDGTELVDNVSRKVRGFNAVTLLGWTTLTSAPDAVLPLIRSGNFMAWQKGMRQIMQKDPSYRQAARDIGVGIENLIHDRMTHMSGEGSQRFTNAFFNATLLTPWTNFMREASAIVGFNAMKAEADTARRLAQQGKFGTRYKTAVRFLARYGLEDYADPQGPQLMDVTQHVRDDKIRYAIMRFTSETIFTPDPNDIPLWSQTPVGKIVFQLKSFPVMMQRMVFGEGGVMSEAFGKNTDGTYKGNFGPLLALVTAGSAFGGGSLALKDLAQSRGGDDDRSRELRNRKISDTIFADIAKAMGVDPKDYAGRPDELVGWWLEGIVAVGGLGFLAELMYNSAEQLDNGAYGATRIASGILGPGVGNFMDVINVGAGIEQGLLGDGDSAGKQRQAARTVAGRVPVLGGVRSFREGAADLMGDPRSTSKNGPKVKDPLAKWKKDI